ncbi:MAG: hypothetical protein AAFU77_10745 [Myxococcota bacterium]
MPTPHALSALRDLYAEANSVDIRGLERRVESAPLKAVASQIADQIHRALALSRQFVDAPLSSVDEPPRSDDDPHARELSTRLDRLVEPNARGAVADIAFLVRLDLESRVVSLAPENLGPNGWQELTKFDGALRALRKALATLERALSEAEGEAPALGFTTELERSLAVRACYGRFKRRVRTLAETVPELRARIRRIGIEIAVLIGRDEYPWLRIGDRHQLRSIQRRVLDWLAEAEPVDPGVGDRIWYDFSTFVDLLILVNRREELIAHDTAGPRVLNEVLQDASTFNPSAFASMLASTRSWTSSSTMVSVTRNRGEIAFGRY